MKKTLLTIIIQMFIHYAFAQMLPISSKELIATSENIVQGKVISTEARWVNNNKYIYTFTNLKVDQVFSGNYKSGDTVTIVTPGGYDPKKDMGMKVSNQAVFEPEEEAIVYLIKADGELDAIDYSFLKNDASLPSDIMRVNGYFQGKHKIVKNKSTGQKMVVRPNENKTVQLSDNNKYLKIELKEMQRKTIK